MSRGAPAGSGLHCVLSLVQHAARVSFWQLDMFPFGNLGWSPGSWRRKFFRSARVRLLVLAPRSLALKSSNAARAPQPKVYRPEQIMAFSTRTFVCFMVSTAHLLIWDCKDLGRVRGCAGLIVPSSDTTRPIPPKRSTMDRVAYRTIPIMLSAGGEPSRWTKMTLETYPLRESFFVMPG